MYRVASGYNKNTILHIKEFNVGKITSQEVLTKMIQLDQNDVSAVLLINFHEHFIPSLRSRAGLLGSDAKAECCLG